MVKRHARYIGEGNPRRFVADNNVRPVWSRRVGAKGDDVCGATKRSP